MIDELVRRRKSANELYPVWTYINNMIIENERKEMVVLSCRRPFGYSALIKWARIGLEASRLTENAQFIDSAKVGYKTH